MSNDRSEMRRHMRYYDAPAALETKIRWSLSQEDSHQEGSPEETLPKRSPAPNVWRWLAFAAGLLLALSVAWNVSLLRSRVDSQRLLAADVLSAHIRSLAGTHLLDVPSSDQHTVKPWFNGKLDFAPDVKFLDGFPLLGGRLEYFDGRPAAALIYGRDKHIINLFTWPSGAPATPAMQTLNGYHLQSWWNGGMTYWAVSDLNETELGQFVGMYRAR